MQTTVNGIKLMVTDEGKGIPIVAIHGFPLSRGAWQKQVDALKSSYRIIAPDLRGMGESEARSGTNTMSQQADDLHALLTQLNTGPVVLMGHSMGGYVTLAFARKYPDMLRGLVLVSTKAGADSPEAAAGRRATAEKVKTEGAHVVVDALAPKMLAAANTDASMARSVRGLMDGSHPDGVIGSLLGMAQRDDSTDLLAQIHVPVLVITGGDDTIMPPAESQKLAGAVKGARLEQIPGSGHLVAFEKADEFNRILRDWLQTSIKA